MRLALAMLVSLALGGCDVMNTTSERPWSAFAWNKKEGRFEWWFSSYASHRDCMESMAYAVSNPPQSEWYTSPIVCAYSSNSYWKAWFFNSLYSDMSRIECIARSTSSDVEKMHGVYSPVIKGGQRRGQNHYCV